jgi:AbrB family looped-hinge helix DNA binding protein
MEVVKMSKKGQLVVPAELRNMLGLNPEDKFIAYGDEDYIIFKKVELPSLKKEFEEIVKITSKIAQEAGITEDVVMGEIRAYRREKAKKAS